MFTRVLRLGIVLLGVTTAAPAAGQAAPDSTAIPQATAAATAWVILLDEGRYEASWDSAAPAFQQAVTQAAWVEAAVRARGPFEPFGKRSLAGAELRATLPNAPPGPYVILRFHTAVAGGRTVTETVVPMRLPDGSWRVSGYFVRPE